MKYLKYSYCLVLLAFCFFLTSLCHKDAKHLIYEGLSIITIVLAIGLLVSFCCLHTARRESDIRAHFFPS